MSNEIKPSDLEAQWGDDQEPARIHGASLHYSPPHEEKVEIEQNVETGEIISANGVPLNEEKESWEKEFEQKSSTGAWGGHYRDEDVDWPLVKDFIRQTIQADRTELVAKVKGMETKYPVEVFTEPPEGWQKELDEFAKSRGYRIDNISACYGRWQEKVVKEEIINLIQQR